MVDGSIGYHTPDHAKMLIKDYKNGKRIDHCERCVTCYDSDLEKMILHDIESFEILERVKSEKAARLIEFIKQVADLDPMEQLTIGLMYPTTHI